MSSPNLSSGAGPSGKGPRKASPGNEASRTLEDLSVFDLLNILRRRLFFSREELTSQITEASKDAFGFFDWIVLKKDFHTKVVAKTIYVLGDGARLDAQSVSRAKIVMFVFLLDIMNGVAAEDFFALKKADSLENRARHEVRRAARKRARAAKRERVRIARKDEKAAKTHIRMGKQDRKSCNLCSQQFESRNARRKHHCPGRKSAPKKGEVVVMASKPTPGPSNSQVVPPVTAPSGGNKIDTNKCCFVYRSSGKVCGLVGPGMTTETLDLDTATTMQVQVCKAHSRAFDTPALRRAVSTILLHNRPLVLRTD